MGFAWNFTFPESCVFVFKIFGSNVEFVHLVFYDSKVEESSLGVLRLRVEFAFDHQ